MIVDTALKAMSPMFDQMYATFGRPSIAPEKLLRALLLQLLYSIRSERLLMEQLEYKLLFRWFVGLNMDESVRDRRTIGELVCLHASSSTTIVAVVMLTRLFLDYSVSHVSLSFLSSLRARGLPRFEMCVKANIDGPSARFRRGAMTPFQLTLC